MARLNSARIITICLLAHSGASTSHSQREKDTWQDRSGIPVLCYHSIVAGQPKDPYSVNQVEFYKQMKWLSDQQYETLTLGQFHAYISGAATSEARKKISIYLYQFCNRPCYG